MFHMYDFTLTGSKDTFIESDVVILRNFKYIFILKTHKSNKSNHDVKQKRMVRAQRKCTKCVNTVVEILCAEWNQCANYSPNQTHKLIVKTVNKFDWLAGGRVSLHRTLSLGSMRNKQFAWCLMMSSFIFHSHIYSWIVTSHRLSVDMSPNLFKTWNSVIFYVSSFLMKQNTLLW